MVICVSLLSILLTGSNFFTGQNNQYIMNYFTSTNITVVTDESIKFSVVRDKNVYLWFTRGNFTLTPVLDADGNPKKCITIFD